MINSKKIGPWALVLAAASVMLISSACKKPEAKKDTDITTEVVTTTPLDDVPQNERANVVFESAKAFAKGEKSAEELKKEVDALTAEQKKELFEKKSPENFTFVRYVCENPAAGASDLVESSLEGLSAAKAKAKLTAKAGGQSCVNLLTKPAKEGAADEHAALAAAVLPRVPESVNDLKDDNKNFDTKAFDKLAAALESRPEDLKSTLQKLKPENLNKWEESVVVAEPKGFKAVYSAKAADKQADSRNRIFAKAVAGGEEAISDFLNKLEALGLKAGLATDSYSIPASATNKTLISAPLLHVLAQRLINDRAVEQLKDFSAIIKGLMGEADYKEYVSVKNHNGMTTLVLLGNNDDAKALLSLTTPVAPPPRPAPAPVDTNLKAKLAAMSEAKFKALLDKTLADNDAKQLKKIYQATPANLMHKVLDFSVENKNETAVREALVILYTAADPALKTYWRVQLLANAIAGNLTISEFFALAQRLGFKAGLGSDEYKVTNSSDANKPFVGTILKVVAQKVTQVSTREAYDFLRDFSGALKAAVNNNITYDALADAALKVMPVGTGNLYLNYKRMQGLLAAAAAKSAEVNNNRLRAIFQANFVNEPMDAAEKANLNSIAADFMGELAKRDADEDTLAVMNSVLSNMDDAIVATLDPVLKPVVEKVALVDPISGEQLSLVAHYVLRTPEGKQWFNAELRDARPAKGLLGWVTGAGASMTEKRKVEIASKMLELSFADRTELASFIIDVTDAADPFGLGARLDTLQDVYTLPSVLAPAKPFKGPLLLVLTSRIAEDVARLAAGSPIKYRDLKQFAAFFSTRLTPTRFNIYATTVVPDTTPKGSSFKVLKDQGMTDAQARDTLNLAITSTGLLDIARKVIADPLDAAARKELSDSYADAINDPADADDLSKAHAAAGGEPFLVLLAQIKDTAPIMIDYLDLLVRAGKDSAGKSKVGNAIQEQGGATDDVIKTLLDDRSKNSAEDSKVIAKLISLSRRTALATSLGVMTPIHIRALLDHLKQAPQFAGLAATKFFRAVGLTEMNSVAEWCAENIGAQFGVAPAMVVNSAELFAARVKAIDNNIGAGDPNKARFFAEVYAELLKGAYFMGFNKALSFGQGALGRVNNALAEVAKLFEPGRRFQYWQDVQDMVGAKYNYWDVPAGTAPATVPQASIKVLYSILYQADLHQKAIGPGWFAKNGLLRFDAKIKELSLAMRRKFQEVHNLNVAAGIAAGVVVAPAVYDASSAAGAPANAPAWNIYVTAADNGNIPNTSAPVSIEDLLTSPPTSASQPEAAAVLVNP